VRRRIGGWRWTATRSKNEFDGCGGARGVGLVVGALGDEDVAGSAVKQGAKDFGGGVGTVAAEDVLVFDGTGDLHACEARDDSKNLVKACIVGDDGEAAVFVGDGGRMVGG
jgi:hypothetical protein